MGLSAAIATSPWVRSVPLQGYRGMCPDEVEATGKDPVGIVVQRRNMVAIGKLLDRGLRYVLANDRHTCRFQYMVLRAVEDQQRLGHLHQVALDERPQAGQRGGRLHGRARVG